MVDERDEMLLEVARLIWKREISIADFYEVLGVNLDDLSHSDPSSVVIELSGIFKGWNSYPPE